MPKEKSCKSYDKIQYSKKVINLFLHPKNVGEIKNASGVGEVGNPICGDVMRIYIKVSDDKIVDIKFKTFGCASAIATSSMMTEMVKGKTLAEVASSDAGYLRWMLSSMENLDEDMRYSLNAVLGS